jgi:hypothetical protein
MSALVLILAAGVMAGGGPEKESGKAGQELELRGEWEGTIAWCESVWAAHYADGKWTVTRLEGDISVVHATLRKVGLGRLMVKTDEFMPAIYKWEGEDRISICLSVKGDAPPSSFEASKKQQLVILRRVKPAKLPPRPGRPWPGRRPAARLPPSRPPARWA